MSVGKTRGFQHRLASRDGYSSGPVRHWPERKHVRGGLALAAEIDENGECVRNGKLVAGRNHVIRTIRVYRVLGRG